MYMSVPPIHFREQHKSNHLTKLFLYLATTNLMWNLNQLISPQATKQ